MKKITAVLLLSTVVVAPAVAADNGFYAGVTLGRSSTNSPTPNVILTKSTDTVGSILAGCQLTSNWGAEVFYTGAGKFSGRNAANTVAASGKADAWGINAVGTLPLSNTFSLYGKLGYASTKTTTSSVPASTFTGATRNAATYGLGGVYNVNQSVGIRFGWDRYGAATAGGSGIVGVKDNFNANVYSLGAVVKF